MTLTAETISKTEKRQFSTKLIKWLQFNRRDFPWRNSNDPYQVLVAELLLQRTKAEQVEPVFETFVSKYRSPKDLAAADVDEIESVISSLGLRKKAEIMKRFAQDIMGHFYGEIPQDSRALLKITGVGHYGANAVLCFSFGMDLPVVDWNVARVFKRLIDYPLKSAPHADKKFIQFVSEFIPKGKARDFNFGILDFAAAICTPRKPYCESCPVTDLCNHFGRVSNDAEKIKQISLQKV